MANLKLLSIEKHIAQRLKARRKELKIKQHELAKTLGITPQQISKYERKLDSISVKRLYNLCKILSVTPNYFFEDLEDISCVIEQDSMWLCTENLRGQMVQMKIGGIRGIIENIRIIEENQ
ncbi:helix-turn-helix domain-containing protein [Candidatus Odyssella thessalonicensis]|uniref:helix-turn-helix domain-containing protein n=1 Tax=Candidatus Odyssella thessalonicensis TaxID=84647 RepID=UPI000225B955|nr:helix-turn-helix transcriptional regulator [Candidatus Odyssella thessalonicensis]